MTKYLTVYFQLWSQNSDFTERKLKNKRWQIKTQNTRQLIPKLGAFWRMDQINQLVLGSGMGKRPAPAAPRGGEKPKNFWRLVLILIEQRKYKKAIEQSVMSSPDKPRWLIFWTIRKGTNGNFATGFPSNKVFNNPKTINKTTATTAPDLNLNRDKSRLDSFKEVSTRSIFLVFDFLVSSLVPLGVFMVSSFLEALSMVDLRDL